MAPSPERQRRQAWLDQIADQAQKLLREEPNPKQQMQWAEQRLSEANLFGWGRPPSDPRGWTQMVIAQNWDLLDEAMPWWEERDIYAEQAETFESLILQLIPSEGGL
jgi:hypothetical protein